MIQTYRNLAHQVNIINNLLNGQVYIQKIYSSSRYIAINLRAVGHTYQLYFGRGHGFEGLWLEEIALESFLRKRDVFLEYLRKHISGSTFLKISIDNKDRIISLHYQKWGRENILSLFYSGRDLYFSNFFFDPEKEEQRLLTSWNSKSIYCENFNYEIFNEVGRNDIDKDESKSLIPIKKLLQEEKKNAKKDKQLNKKLKFLKRKCKNIENDLQKVALRSEILKLIETDQDLSSQPREIRIHSLKIIFKEKDHFKRRDQLYEKVKSFKKAEKLLTERLMTTESQIENFGQETFQNNLSVNKVKWLQVESVKEQVNSNETSQDFDTLVFMNMTMAIGKSAKGNDYIRSKWANKNDLWFHLDGDKSSHLICKNFNQDSAGEVFSFIGTKLVEYSKLNYTQADLIYTQVKNLKGVKNSPGKVIFKKEKRIRVEINNSFLSNL